MTDTRFASMTSANVKMMRAQEHLASLEQELAAFRQEITCPVRRECERDSLQQLWIVDEELPSPSYRFSLFIGDFLYNTRAALDHLVWDLVIASGNIPTRGNAFPLCDTPEEWSRVHPRRLQGVENEMLIQIRESQPCFGKYPFRNRRLAQLNELGNIDKHRRFNLTMTATDGGFWLPGLPSPDDTFIHTGAIRSGTVLARCPGAYFDVDFRPLIGIAFSDGIAAGENAYQVLVAIREVTRLTLDQFQRFLPRVVTA